MSHHPSTVAKLETLPVNDHQPAQDTRACHMTLPHDTHRWDTEDREPLRYTCPGHVKRNADEACGDYPAPCNCDDPTTHDGALTADQVPTAPTADWIDDLARLAEAAPSGPWVQGEDPDGELLPDGTGSFDGYVPSSEVLQVGLDGDDAYEPYLLFDAGSVPTARFIVAANPDKVLALIEQLRSTQRAAAVIERERRRLTAEREVMAHQITEARRAADLVREYVNTGGEAYEVIQADRILAAELDTHQHAGVAMSTAATPMTAEDFSMRWDEHRTFPFFQDEDARIFGYGHPDKVEAARWVAEYYAYTGDADVEVGPSDVDHHWAVRDTAGHNEERFIFARYGDGNLPVPVRDDEPGAFPIWTVVP